MLIANGAHYVRSARYNSFKMKAVVPVALSCALDEVAGALLAFEKRSTRHSISNY